MSELQSRIARLSPEQKALLAQRLTKKPAETTNRSARMVPCTPDPAHRYDPFPLNELQQAYWLGRGGAYDLGNLATGAYLEIEVIDLDVDRFRQAWQHLIERHDMLRIVVLETGEQKVIERVSPYRIEVTDLRNQPPEAVSLRLKTEQTAMLERIQPVDQWPLSEVRISLLDDRKAHVHFFFDLLNVDAGSVAILFRELTQLYKHPRSVLPPVDITFRDYVLAEPQLQETDEFKRSRDYWIKRIADMPPAPELPFAKNPSAVVKPRFVRRTTKLDPDLSKQLRARTAEYGVTNTGLLLSALGVVLAAWCRSPRFTLNLPIFNRFPLHEQVKDIVGAFTTVSLLAFDYSAPETFENRARRIQEQLLEDLDHRYFDGVKVIREVLRVHGNGAMPFVFTSLVDVGFSESVAEFGEIVSGINQTAQVWMDVHVDEHAGSLLIKWDAVEELFPPGMVDHMLEAYVRVLRDLAVSDEAWKKREFDLLPHPQTEILTTFNATEGPLPAVLIQDLFDEQVNQRPQQPAVIAADLTLTYADLARRSNLVGRRLRELGARPNTLVAVVMEKGWEQVVGVYAVLRSGAAYLPIDPELPKERLWYLLDHGQVQIVLTQSWLEERLEWPTGVQRLHIDDSLRWAEIDAGPLEPVQSPDDLAYVIYTSGSTGLPKGAMLTHRNVVNRMPDINERFAIGPADRVIGLTALQHDLSVYDLFGTFMAGATLVLPSHAGRRDPAHWLDLVVRERITIWNSVPAFMEMFVEYVESSAEGSKTPPRSLRFVILAGDWIPVSLPDRLRTIVPQIEFISSGGPTETTVWDVYYRIENTDPNWKSIPYGRPLKNTKYYILNEKLEICPFWVTGELYIAGAGLGRGYWRDDDKTNERFIRHPKTGERLYRSGDTGRYLPDGNMEFMGRTDFQVKIQGQRIELGEIEASLLQHPGVCAAVVIVAGDTHAKKRLVGYFVPNNAQTISLAELVGFLQQKLPQHMVPATLIALERLPLTVNGKVDRRALPMPEESEPKTARSQSAVDSIVHRQVEAIVKKVLALDQIDPQTNFLAMGANSLDMVRIGNQLEQVIGVRPRMDQIFRLQTVDAITTYCEEQLGSSGSKAAEESKELGMDAELKAIIQSFNPLRNPEEREAFKNAQLGIRRDDADRGFVQLMRPVEDDALRNKYRATRSHRTFGLKPIPLKQFGELLECFYQITLNGKPKYLYASAGVLYPIQVYLHIKPGRVEGVPAGAYYYHPIQHRLVTLTPNVEIDRSIHVPFINTPVFDEAAFSIFFVAELAAIVPMYGERSIPFILLEVGGLAYLIELSGRACGLGMCQIGGVDFEKIRHLFALNNSHYFVHSMLGGPMFESGTESANVDASIPASSLSKAASLLQRVKQLSEKDIKTLIDQNKMLDKGSNAT